MIELDIVERLRGKVRVPVNDGAGLLDGKDFFERTFPTSKAAMEAADEIEKLRHALRVLLEEATNFSVSGVYFDEDCMGHKGPELARKALYP